MFLYSLSTTHILLMPLFELFILYSTKPALFVLKMTEIVKSGVNKTRLAIYWAALRLMTAFNNHYKRILSM